MTSRPRQIFHAAIAALSLGASVGPSEAQEYPSKPVHVVVGFAPGSPVDIVARIVAQNLAETLKQPVLVENAAGSGGAVGARRVEQSRGDGYTLLVAPDLDSKALVRVAVLGKSAYAVVTKAESRIKTAKDLVALSKQQMAGRMSYASTGNGSQSHIAMDELMESLGLSLTHVPYKGTSAALSGLLGGDVDVAMLPSGSVETHVKAGKLKALAVTAEQRSRALHDTPTVSEAFGVPYSFYFRLSLYAPISTASSIIGRLNREANQATRNPQVQQQLLRAGVEYGPDRQEGDPGPGKTCGTNEKWCECKKKCIPQNETCASTCRIKFD